MIAITEKMHCTGCQACFNICPHDSITMESDEEGFWYPKVDLRSCVNCGLCERACPILNKTTHSHLPTAYAAYNKNCAVRMNSSSGGLFTLIAEQVIDAAGAVFGAAFDDSYNVVHVCVENKEELSRLRGSKYVQSKIGNTYKQALTYLKAGRLVLFTGTPCQIGGFKTYLGTEYANLITQDIICHGVPSPKVWRRYVRCRIDKEGKGSSFDRFSFRSKQKGWQQYSVQISFTNGGVYEKSRREDTYMRAFLSDVCLRPSCYHCPYKVLARDSDLTLADYWGVQAQCPKMDDDRGTSLVFVHSRKGAIVFDKIKDKICYQEVNVKEAIYDNQSAVKASAWNPRRGEFLAQLNRDDFDALSKKYCQDKVCIRNLLRTVLVKLRLLNMIKKILGKEENKEESCTKRTASFRRGSN